MAKLYKHQVPSGPTSPKDKAFIDAIVFNLSSKLSLLWARWQDEKEYEDIKDYGNAVRKALPKEITFYQMTKRPFGFVFGLGNSPARYLMAATSTTIRWERLPDAT